MSSGIIKQKTGAWTLLWKNSNISAGMEQTTIPLDLNNYKWVRFICQLNEEGTTTKNIFIQEAPVDSLVPCEVCIWTITNPWITLGNTGTKNIYGRLASISNTGITFKTGHFHSFNGTSQSAASNDKNCMIPIEIWGRK